MTALSKLVSAMSASDVEWFLVSGFSFLAEVCLHFLVSRFWFLVSSLRGVCGFWLGCRFSFLVSGRAVPASSGFSFLVSGCWFLLSVACVVSGRVLVSRFSFLGGFF